MTEMPVGFDPRAEVERLLPELSGNAELRKVLLPPVGLEALPLAGVLIGRTLARLKPHRLGAFAFNLLNYTHHFLGAHPDFIEAATRFVNGLFGGAGIDIVRQTAEDHILVFFGHGGQTGAPLLNVLNWDRQMASVRRLTAIHADGGARIDQPLPTGLHQLEARAGWYTIVIDDEPVGEIELQEADYFTEAFTETFIELLTERMLEAPDGAVAWSVAHPDFFIRKVGEEVRNLLWDRHVQISGHHAKGVTISDLPFEVLCGYLHGRNLMPFVPLALHPELRAYFAEPPFGFRYFESQDASIFLLADFADDFSRLAALRNREALLAAASGVLQAYLDDNLSFAQKIMGRAYTLLTEEDDASLPDLPLSRFLTRVVRSPKSERPNASAEDKVVFQAADLGARLVVLRAETSLLPSHWRRHIEIALKRIVATFRQCSTAHNSPQTAFVLGAAELALDAFQSGRHPDRLSSIDYSSLSDPRLSVVALPGKTGLGANGIMFWRSLSKLFANAEFLETDLGRRNVRRKAAQPEAPLRVSRQINIFVMNGDLLIDASKLNPSICRQAAYNIGFLLWETTRLPQTYLTGVELLDEIWVPSEYLKNVFEAYVPDNVPVINIGKHIDLLPGRSFSLRERLGLSDEPKIFLAIGDFGSSLPRKNIEAAVEAFLLADPNPEDAVLVLKIRQIDREHWSNHNRIWERIEARIRNDRRIYVLEGNLSDEDYWGLLQDIDCMISLHRSEGFGYGISHCHGLGKLSIVSDYSGTRDFCSEKTSFVIPCREVPVNPLDMNQRYDIGVWAEPSVENAAEAIRRVVNNDPTIPAKVAAARAEFAERYYGDKFVDAIRSRIASVPGALVDPHGVIGAES